MGQRLVAVMERADQGSAVQAARAARPEPLQALFSAVAAPLATAQTQGSWYRGLRLMSIDGTCIDVADTPPNEAAFSRPGTGRGEGAGAFPQVRLVGLAECGTHALTGAAIGACTSGEPTLTRDLLGSLGEGMLVLADRNFYGFELWSEAAATGAQLLWRTKAGHVLPPGERLPDGSYLSHLRRFAGHRHRMIDTDVVVRVIDYGIDDPGRPQAERSRGGGRAPALLSLAQPLGERGRSGLSGRRERPPVPGRAGRACRGSSPRAS